MYILVTYDVATSTSGGAKRLHRVAKLCERYGQRVQASVFECLVTPADEKTLVQSILATIDPASDSVRVYNLGNNWEHRVQHYGAKESYNPEGTLCF
jgi:CRISPR-associated protein Cas2